MAVALQPDHTIDGIDCVTRDTLARAAGKSRTTINHAARTDTDFPTLHAKHGRAHLYRLDDARTYLATLATRDAAKKPTTPTPGPGPHDQLLDPAQVAAELNLSRNTIDYYIHRSKPHWHTSTPTLLPPPDEITPRGKYQSLRWRRDTIHHHHTQRPGTGAGAGRKPHPHNKTKTPNDNI